MKRWMLGVASILAGSGTAALAQGMPVFDNSTFAQTLATVRNTLRMIEQGREQISEAQRLYASMNRLTNVNSIGTILSRDTVRNLLPPEARDIERLMAGEGGGGALDARAERILQDAGIAGDAVDPNASEADRAYRAAVEAASRRSATSAALADTAFDASTQRTVGLEELRRALDGASDPKAVADLQARIAVETAHIQNDQMQLQAVAMRQAAQQQIELGADDARMLRDLRASLGKGK